MSRVLIVHSDVTTRNRFARQVEASGHEAFVSSELSHATLIASVLDIALVLLDEEMLERHTGAPIARLEAALAGVVPIVPFRPSHPDLEALGPEVKALLRRDDRSEGGFADDSFERLLRQVEASRRSGVLTAYRDMHVKKVALQNGAIVFAASNSTRERIGQALLRAGLVTEDDLRDALRAQANHDHRPITRILQALDKIRTEQVRDVLRTKFREAVVELFSWTDGRWIFRPTPATARSDIAVPLGPVLEQGTALASCWRALADRFPSDALQFESGGGSEPLPEDATDRHILVLAATGMPLERILLELRAPRYAVLERLSKLIDRGDLRITDVPGKLEPREEGPEGLPREPDRGALQEDAERLLLDGQPERARAAFLALLREDPSNGLARLGLAEAEREIGAQLTGLGISRSRTIRRLPDEPTPAGIGPKELFLLTRVSAAPGRTMSVGDLIDIAPMEESELLSRVRRLLEIGAVTLDPVE